VLGLSALDGVGKPLGVARVVELVDALEWARDWALDRLAEQRLRRRGAQALEPIADPEDRLISVQLKAPKPKPGEKTFRDAADAIVVDEDTRERILEIAVRGKRGVGYCKSMPGAVPPFQRVVKRNRLKPTDPLFGPVQRELLNSILNEIGLKRDRQGNPRTAYSLRHTYICLRLMEGRTSTRWRRTAGPAWR
jgi:hypothetical protein